MEEAIFPYYEELLGEFEEEHGREATDDEQGKLWEDATEMCISSACEAGDALRKYGEGE